MNYLQKKKKITSIMYLQIQIFEQEGNLKTQQK